MEINELAFDDDGVCAGFVVMRRGGVSAFGDVFMRPVAPVDIEVAVLGEYGQRLGSVGIERGIGNAPCRDESVWRASAVCAAYESVGFICGF